ncbi:MAG TPA: hypothetical protein VFQ05_02785 [Candidatus Eisenbacteria bacterium]|nr:hypothetical protein [Candidatus Eisenbacteria bacterium]
MRFLVLLLAAATLAGCSKKIRVESDTTWEGTVNGATVTGTGDQTYELNGDTNCYTLKKTTAVGYLRVKIKKGTGSDQSTEAEFGEIRGCLQ